MATQYTSILKLALPVTGELSGTWGDVVNNNITSMIEQAIAGLSTINTWTANAHTLTVADGTTSESRCAMLVAADGSGGTALSAAGEIICPAASKLYVLKNGSSYAITLKTAAGTGVAVPAGDTAFLFCDGTNVNSCVTTVVNGHISGNLTVDGNTTLGDANTDTVTVNAQFNTDLLPSTDNARDLGSTAKSWRTLYCDTSVLVGNLSLSGNTLSSTDTNGNVVIAPNGTGDVQLDADTVRIGDSNANATLTTNGTGDLILNTNAGTNSGSITIQDGVDGDIIIAPNGNGQVQITNASLDLTTIEVSNINAKDGTAAITLADSTGAVGISTAVTMSATTQNINIGTSQTSGELKIGGTAQTGTILLGQSTKTQTVSIADGATESGLSKAVQIGTGGAAGSTTTISIGGGAGTVATNFSGTLNAVTTNIIGTLTASNAVTFSATTQNIALGTSQSSGTWTAGGASQTGALTLDQSTKTHTLNLGTGATESGETKTINLGTGGVSTSTTAINIGSANGTTLTINSSAVSTPNGLNFDSNTLVIDAANNRVGINNASPTVALDVTGALTISGNAILGDATTDTHTINGTTTIVSGSANLKMTRSSNQVGFEMASTSGGLVGLYDYANSLYRWQTTSTSTTLGNASTDTVTVNGYMGVGGAPSSDTSVYIRSSALTGTTQWGVLCNPIASSAATSGLRVVQARAQTAAASFTAASVYAFYADNATLGSTSAITNQYGVYVADQTNGTNNYGITSAVSSGSNKWNIYASGTAVNYFAGAVGIGTSSPSTYSGAGMLAVVGSAPSFPNGLIAGYDSQAAAVDVGGVLTLGGQDGAIANRAFAAFKGGKENATSGNYASYAAFATRANGGSMTERMRLDSSGNLGIGTSSPLDRLDVVSSGGTYRNRIRNSTTAEAILMFQNSTTGTTSTDGLFVGIVFGADAYLWQNENASLIFGSNNAERLRLSTTEAVFNEPGNDYDFRVESDTNTHMLFVDAGNNRVGVGTSVPSQIFSVNNPTATGDVAIGFMTNGVERSYINHNGNSGVFTINAGYAGYGGSLLVNTNGVQRLGINSAGNVVFNEDGVDADFRVESDTNTHALFVQGSDGYVGIGTNAPISPLQVVGDIRSSGDIILVGGAGTPEVQFFQNSGNWKIAVDNDAMQFIDSSASAERMRITGAGNVSIGGNADRATTVGTKALNIFNGTAPVGTLTDGISIYSSSGEAYVMDAAGNATLFSPHDRETNEWIFKSKHTPTGKVLKIDVEKLLRFVNDHFGLDAIQEFIEE